MLAASCSFRRALCRPLVIGRAPKRCLLGPFIVHLIREGARFFCAIEPVLWIVDEGCWHDSPLPVPTPLDRSHRLLMRRFVAVRRAADVAVVAARPHPRTVLWCGRR